MKDKRIISIFIVLGVIIAILGGTLAYWSWSSNNTQKTNITFTTGANFSCSADGGGNIANTNYFVPTDCTNSTYAIKRTITTNITNSGSNPVYMDMWLNINSIGSGLSNSENFKYALTTSGTNCTTGVVSQGNFNGKVANDKVNLLSEVSSAGTYYLWVWLDAAETSSSTMNQSVSLSLGGTCTDEAPNYTYTVNLYDENATGYNSVWIGQTIPSGITQYTTPGDAITALELAYSSANSGATASLPFYLRHTVGDFLGWCMIRSNDTSNCIYNAPTEADCNTAMSNEEAPDGNTYTCINITVSNAVTESYVGFVVTPAMATANPGMVAGTYYLKGGDNGVSFLDNAKTIYDAFGGVGCYLDDNSGGNPYTTTPSSYFDCGVSGLYVQAKSNGYVDAGDDAGSYCKVRGDGRSDCRVEGYSS